MGELLDLISDGGPRYVVSIPQLEIKNSRLFRIKVEFDGWNSNVYAVKNAIGVAVFFSALVVKTITFGGSAVEITIK